MKGSDVVAEKGWIKTYRQIQDCWIWKVDEPFDRRSAWLDLLLSANHKDVKLLFNGNLIDVKRGQLITSVRNLANKWQWSKDRVLKFLRVLENDTMIERDSDNHRTLITIVNYGVYQDKQDTENTEESTQTSTQTSTQNGHTLATNKNDKNDKNDKNIYISDFKIIYDSYPKKVGKTKGYEYYKAWVTDGRVISGIRHKLTNKQIWSAIAKYKREMEEKETELQYYKNFDTFMCKAILDYVEDEECHT